MIGAWRNRTSGALHFHIALHAQRSHGMYTAPHNTFVGHQGLVMYLELSAALALLQRDPRLCMTGVSFALSAGIQGPSGSSGRWLRKKNKTKTNEKINSCIPSAESPAAPGTDL